MKFASFFFCNLILATGFATQSRAEVLVEIFTAKACEVCRSAEALVQEIAKRDDVVAVALHVDYWDYLEDDLFADPAFGARQVGYNNAGELKELFTPQIILNGEKVEDAANYEAMFQALDLETNEDTMTAAVTGGAGEILVELEAGPDLLAGDYDITWMRAFTNDEILEIDPDSTKYHAEDTNLIRLIRSIGEWDGVGSTTLTAEVETPAKGVLVVQENDLGKVVFAQSVDLGE